MDDVSTPLAKCVRKLVVVGHCCESIYSLFPGIVFFDAENLAAMHLCPCRNKQLVPKMDKEIKKMIYEIEVVN